ncbi:peroxisomal targeting signal 1 receptor [Orussus abietinus]|uniref:peroxisomal targeting signal 1 receptor n=1 Tax=Orussus abietinus TaxID=222816 RepID=UPI0006253847|nr:peroxisomal targeting signal 1 receptor [Orussus abietinus]
MALRELVEGDCSGPSPLVRITSHFVEDRGFKEEGIFNGLAAEKPIEATTSQELVEQFMDENSMHPQTFRMDNLIQEMNDVERQIHSPKLAPGIVVELIGEDSSWANQYVESGRHFDERHADNIWDNAAESAVPEDVTGLNPLETHELGLDPKWAEEYLEQSVEGTEKTESASPPDVEKEDPNLAYSKFMKFMHQEEASTESDQAFVTDCERLNEKWAEEFSATEETEKANEEEGVLNKVEEQLEAAGKWVEEFSKGSTASTSGAEDYASSFWTRLQKEWEKAAVEGDSLSAQPWLSEYEKYYDPFKEYAFESQNPMADLADPLAEGKRRLEEGDLPGAVLCFEAAIKKNDTDPEAWFLLGRTQAENEQDPMAIVALKRSLTLDPSNATALMALAVSYTNESYQNQACVTLREWLLRNSEYQHLVSARTAPSTAINVSTVLFDEILQEVKDLFIQAARINPQGHIDPNVQCGLGVLFNLSNEYDKAADCFRAALQVRPDDSRLWNRLGATLANGQCSEEAVQAYHRALELSPGFIRARYNLGITCINLGAYKEAGEHLLAALNQQASGHGIRSENALRLMSDTIWSTLRLIVSLMHKYHLNEAIENRDLAKLNEEFGMD